MTKVDFANARTEWQGLWYHPEYHNYSSAFLNLKALKDFKGTCQVRMFKNRQKRKGDNRPTYLFTICSKDAFEGVNVEELNIVDMTGLYHSESNEADSEIVKAIKMGALDAELKEAEYYSYSEVETLLEECIRECEYEHSIGGHPEDNVFVSDFI